jgi:hypothetical protein
MNGYLCEGGPLDGTWLDSRTSHTVGAVIEVEVADVCLDPADRVVYRYEVERAMPGACGRLRFLDATVQGASDGVPA